MKSALRPLLLCAVVAGLPAVAWAGPWHMGVRTGLSLTNIHGDFADLIDPDYKVGFRGGGFVEIVPGPVGVALEMSYVEKGFTTRGRATDDVGNPLGTVEGHLKLRYLEVPVLLRASLPPRGTFEPYAVLGPAFGFALGAEFEVDTPGFVDQDLGNDLKDVDMGGTVGLGAIIGRGPYRLTVETRYSTSFGDLWDISGNFESINHGFGFTVGVIR